MGEASCTASPSDDRRRVITTPSVPINTTLSVLTINKIVETGNKCNESRDSFPAGEISTKIMFPVVVWDDSKRTKSALSYVFNVTVIT